MSSKVLMLERRPSGREDAILARKKREDRNPDATDFDIPGPNKEAARYVRNLVGDASLRGVELKTGVTYRTVDTLLKGGSAETASVIKLGRAYGRNPNELLSLLSMDTVPEFNLLDWSHKLPADTTVPENQAVVIPTDDVEVSGSDYLTESLRLRLSVEVETVGPDGTARPLSEEELSQEMRQAIAKLLLRGGLTGSSSKGGG